MPKGIPKKGINKGWFKKNHNPKTKGKRSYTPICVYCKKPFNTSDKRNKFCSHSCSTKFLWDNNLISKEKLLKAGFNTRFKKGNHNSLKTEFKKGQNKGNTFAKGNIPWNYIDGRSKLLSPVRYGDDWNMIRLLIYKRDNYKCQKCNITMNDYGRAMDVHHIIPFLSGGSNDMNNLITLCRSCHMKMESKINKKLKQLNIRGDKL